MGSTGFLYLRVVENLICAQNGLKGLKYRGMLECIILFLWVPVEFYIFSLRSGKPEHVKPKKKKKGKNQVGNSSQLF